MVITATPAMFIHTPALIICGMVTIREPNTIAFGGVATGIMKAQLAAMVAGKISK